MPGPSFDPKAALSYGKFVNAAYTMYTGPANTRPPPSADFPADYELAAWILMRDFIIVETAPVFYGFIANKKNDPTKLVVAIRGTDNPAEIWDDLNALGMRAFLVNGVQIGNVALGFDRIYETMQIVPVFDIHANAPEGWRRYQLWRASRSVCKTACHCKAWGGG